MEIKDINKNAKLKVHFCKHWKDKEEIFIYFNYNTYSYIFQSLVFKKKIILVFNIYIYL